MADSIPPRARKTQSQDRADRLKAALKANMGRRKAQAKARAADDKPKKENDKD